MLYPRRPQTLGGTVVAPSLSPSSDSTLLTNPSATPNPTQLPPALTGTGSAPTITITTSSTPATSSINSANTTQTSQSDTHASSISTPALVGAVLGSVAFLSLVLTLIVWHTRRSRSQRRNGDIQNARNRERRQSKRELWKSLSDGEEVAPDMKLKPVAASYPPLPSTTMLREKQFSKSDRPPQLPLPPVSPLPFTSKFDPLVNASTPSPDSLEPPRHPYSNIAYRPPYSDSPTLERTVAPPKPETIPQSEFHAFSHPYAVATPLHRHFSSSPQAVSSLLPETDDQSFYSMDSPALSGSFAKQQQDPSLRDSYIPERTGNQSHNHNPFFTAHPSSHDGPERWGSVGKARTVVAAEHHDRSPSHSSAMENLIAALSLGPSPSNTVKREPINPLNRSQHGHLGISNLAAPSPSPSPSVSDVENENPFEFDEVYGQDIAFSTVTNTGDPMHSHSGDGSLSTGASLMPDGPSPGMFPMPPR